MTHNLIWRVRFAEGLSRHSKNQFAKSLLHLLHLLIVLLCLTLTHCYPTRTLWSPRSDRVQTCVHGENHILVQWQRWKYCEQCILCSQKTLWLWFIFLGEFPHFSMDEYSHWLPLVGRVAGVPFLLIPSSQQPRHAAFYKKARSQANGAKLCRVRQRLSKGAEHSPF